MASPLNYAANKSGKIKSPSKKVAGLAVSHQPWFPARERGEIFFLDIPFHRMSVNALFSTTVASEPLPTH